jgi:spore germination cell wall hydrolase CwlJ-like protein
LNKIDALSTIKTVPETTISSIVESATAPVTIETSIPETKETIHTKETEPSTTPTATVSTKAPTTAPTKNPTKPTSANPNVNPEELELLACVIYQEAGGNASCDNCRRYVADIVLNRMEHEEFPDTMKEVLTQEGQYGRFHYTGVKWPARAKYDTEKDAVERAYRIAEEVLSGQHSKLYGNGYIWQAGFVQGSSGFRCCGHWYGK